VRARARARAHMYTQTHIIHTYIYVRCPPYTHSRIHTHVSYIKKRPKETYHKSKKRPIIYQKETYRIPRRSSGGGAPVAPARTHPPHTCHLLHVKRDLIHAKRDLIHAKRDLPDVKRDLLYILDVRIDSMYVKRDLLDVERDPPSLQRTPCAVR
jgi:hypothetical protein